MNDSFKITKDYYEIELPDEKDVPVISLCESCGIQWAEVQSQYKPNCPKCGKIRKIL